MTAPKPVRQDLAPMAAPDPRAGARAESRRRADVVRMIRDLIERRGLSAGDRLPSERKLATEFGVSRGSVREGLQFLAIMGAIDIRHGGGSYLLPTHGAQAPKRDRWRQWVVEHRAMVLETLELRLGAEVFAARLAARRAGPEDIERLLEAMLEMRAVCAEQPVDTGRFVDCDLAFHDALLRAAGNRTLRDLILALGEELLPERAAVTDLEGRVAKTYDEHLAIYEALRAGDPVAAAEAMTRHIESVRQDVLTRVLAEDGIDTLVVGERAAGRRTAERRHA